MPAPKKLDLSAGFVPAQTATEQASPTVDLSAGIVPSQSTSQEQSQPSSQPGGVANFLTNAREALGLPEVPDHPIDQAVADAKQLFTHPIDTAKQYLVDPLVNIAKAPGETLQSGVADMKRGDLSKGLAKSVYSVIPAVGPGMAKASDQLTAGDYSGGSGTLVGLGAGIAAPEIVKGARGAMSKAMKPLSEKVAPAAAESSLGVRAVDRRHLADKGAIGKAALDELTANKPEDILAQAHSKIAEYGDQLNDIADQSPKPVSLKAAFDALDQIEDTANRQNSAQELKIVQKIRDQLTRRASDGSPIASEPTAREVLDLKRGIGKLKNWESPSQAALAGPIVDHVYGAMDGALDAALPETQGLNQKLSAMMKISNRAEDLTNQAPVAQKGFARLAAQTGALAGPIMAGVEASKFGGPLVGVPAGVGAAFAQEALSSPAARMAAARMMRRRGAVSSRMSPATANAVRGTLSANMAAQQH